MTLARRPRTRCRPLPLPGTPSGTTGRQSSFCNRTPGTSSRARSRRHASLALVGRSPFGELPDDGYSLASRHDKLWLPAAAAVGETSQPTGDQQRFLTDVPPAEGCGSHDYPGGDQDADWGGHGEARRRGRLREYTECVRRNISVAKDGIAIAKRAYQTGCTREATSARLILTSSTRA